MVVTAPDQRLQEVLEKSVRCIVVGIIYTPNGGNYDAIVHQGATNIKRKSVLV